MRRKPKPFIAFIADADRGGTCEYLFYATTRRRVERDVREWCKRADWDATIVAIHPAVGHREARGRRLLGVAGITFAAVLRFPLVAARGGIAGRGRSPSLPSPGHGEQRKEFVRDEDAAAPVLVQSIDPERDERRANVG